jgi:hypothetical protein
MSWRMKMHDAPIRWDDTPVDPWPEGQRHVATFHGDFVARERDDGRVLIHRADRDGPGKLLATIEPSALGGYSVEEGSEELHLHEHSAADKRLGLRDKIVRIRDAVPLRTHVFLNTPDLQAGLRALNERNRRFWEAQEL